MAMGLLGFLSYAQLVSRSYPAAAAFFAELIRRKADFRTAGEAKSYLTYEPAFQAVRCSKQYLKAAKLDVPLAKELWRKVVVPEFNHNREGWYLPHDPSNPPLGRVLSGIAGPEHVAFQHCHDQGLLSEKGELLFCGVLVQGESEGEVWFGLGNSETFRDVLSENIKCHGEKIGDLKRPARIEWIRDKGAYDPSRFPGTLPDDVGREAMIAVDTTLLLAADSYLGCVLREPRAREAFHFVVSVYCGCEKFYFKQPATDPQKMTPLLKLFYEKASGSKRHNLNTHKRFSDSAKDAVQPFRLLIQDPKLPKWVRHQLCDPRMDTIYWTGGTPFEDLKTSHRVLRDTELLERPNPLVTGLQRRGDPAFALQEGAARYGKDFGSVMNYAMVYSFSVMARGPVYAHHEVKPEYAYAPSWVRHRVLPDREGKERVFSELINWGWILDTLQPAFYQKRLETDVEEEDFCNALRRLRKFLIGERKNVPLSALVGDPKSVGRYVQDALEEANFPVNVLAGDVLRCCTDPKAIVQPRARLTGGEGAFAGMSFWRAESAIEEVLTGLVTGSQPPVEQP
jgi:hypothetical protein